MKQTKSSISYIGKEYRNEEPVIIRDRTPPSGNRTTPTKTVRFSEETLKKADKKEQTVEDKEVNTDKVNKNTHFM